jgi:hypothetical protein
MDDLLKEAIADAKAVRETALENAKIALEEAFTPRLKSMLSQKIQSEAGSEYEDEDWEDEEEEDEEGGEEEEPEVAVEPEAGEEEGDEYEDEEEEPEAEEDDEEEPEIEEEGIIEIDGVKYAPVVSETHDDEEEAEDEEDEPEVEEEGAEDASEDLDLEAILRELEDEINEEEDEDPSEVAESEDEEDVQVETVDVDGKTYYRFNEDAENIEEEEESDEVDEAKDTDEVDEAKETEEVDESEEAEDEVVSESEEDLEETIDLEDVLEALSEEDDVNEEEKDKTKTVESLTSDLDEHRRVVKYLRSKLNEVNLLNAKLLFTNKLFRAHGLSEDQKYKVVEQFDRAQTLREVKLVYATLSESFSVGAKREIKESKGAASKPVSSTKPSREPEVLQEGAELKDRFKKLANIL